MRRRCFRYVKDKKIKANHNKCSRNVWRVAGVFDISKIMRFPIKSESKKVRFPKTNGSSLENKQGSIWKIQSFYLIFVGLNKLTKKDFGL